MSSKQGMGRGRTEHSSSDTKGFEQALGELEKLVDQLEQGEMSLEDSLAAFELGVTLTRRCQRALDAAEQKVRILTEASEDAEPQPFVTDD